jgi:hypothetical protein
MEDKHAKDDSAAEAGSRLSEPVQPKRPRIPGSARDKIQEIAPDFDAPLEDFKRYE